MQSLLVVDDEPTILHAFRRAFSRADVNVLTATTGKEGLDVVKERQPNVVVLDINLPDASGMDVFRRIHELDQRTPVIFITGHGTTDTAIEAMKLGAFDYLFKPLELPQLEEVLEHAFEVSRLMRVPAVLEPEPAAASADLLIGRSPKMQEVYKAIGLVAPQDVTVLILGETGTGKELIARAIYHHSRRSKGPFQAINCAAIPESLLESELFGHEKGAFTGADRQRIGKFEQCARGTLFLDEIGDMTPLTQAKILRVLQDQRFERVGGNTTIHTNVRVIAATNRPLDKLIAEERFRSDLYYRLSGFTIHLPPLRERGDDLALLVQYFLKRFSEQLGKPVHQITPKALEILQNYPWPGNVRELQGTVKQAMLRATAPILMVQDLPSAIHAGESAASKTSAEFPDLDRFINDHFINGTPKLFEQVVAKVKKHLLLGALRQTNGNQVRAAKLLGITRSTLRNEIRNLNITIDRSVSSQ
jgi:two-component system, NtrC family, nitrogen regulation response regulator GlnG